MVSNVEFQFLKYVQVFTSVQSCIVGPCQRGSAGSESVACSILSTCSTCHLPSGSNQQVERQIAGSTVT